MVKMTLVPLQDGYKEHTKTVYCNEDVVAISMSMDMERDETVVYAFDTTNELIRLPGYVTRDELTDTIESIYDFVLEEI